MSLKTLRPLEEGEIKAARAMLLATKSLFPQMRILK
jgi:hypothetical protein